MPDDLSPPPQPPPYPQIPNVQVSKHRMPWVPPGAMSDRDNFVRNRMTLLAPGYSNGYGSGLPWPPGYFWDGAGDYYPGSQPVQASYDNAAYDSDVYAVPKLSDSARYRTPVLSLDEIKMHCRIDQDVEDDYLQQLEMAARIHTEGRIRLPIDEFVGENVKQAMLFLIGHWYKSREAVTDTRYVPVVPLAYDALLSMERDYPPGIY